MHMSGKEDAPSGGGCPFGHGALPREATEASFQDPGVKYLASRADLRYFPLLWEVRSRLGGGYGG